MLVDSLGRLSDSSRRAVLAGLVIVSVVAFYGWVLSPHVNYLFAVQRYAPVAGTVANEKQEMSDSLHASLSWGEDRLDLEAGRC